MKLLNATFSRNALLCSFVAVVAAWVGENFIEPMKDLGPAYAAGAFLIVHAWNYLYALGRRRFGYGLLIVLVGLAASANAQPGYFQPTSDPVQLPLGAILNSRNLNEADNRTPLSYWNHQAEFVGDTDGDGFGEVIEAQSGPPYGYGVIRTRLVDFLARPYRVIVFYPIDLAEGQRAAAIATTFVGRPYRRYSSLFPHLIPSIVPTLLRGTPAGMNCTSVGRDSHEQASGRVLAFWHEPDDVFYRGDLFHGPYELQRQPLVGGGP